MVELDVCVLEELTVSLGPQEGGSGAIYGPNGEVAQVEVSAWCCGSPGGRREGEEQEVPQQRDPWPGAGAL